MTILLIILGVMNVLAFLVYALDKSRARRGAWRISEATLMAFSLLGGGLGGYLAMFICHHKTRKWYFHLVNVLGLVIIVVAIIMVSQYGLDI